MVEEECKRAHAFGIYHLTDMRIVPFFCASESAAETAEWLEAMHQSAQGVFNLPQGGAHGEAALAEHFDVLCEDVPSLIRALRGMLTPEDAK